MAFPFTEDIFPHTDFNKVNLDWICDTLQKDRADIDQNTADITELKNTVIDYDDLINKPQINSVTLSGDKSLSDIGAASADDLGDLKDAIALASDGKYRSYLTNNFIQGRFYLTLYEVTLVADEPHFVYSGYIDISDLPLNTIINFVAPADINVIGYVMDTNDNTNTIATNTGWHTGETFAWTKNNTQFKYLVVSAYKSFSENLTPAEAVGCEAYLILYTDYYKQIQTNTADISTLKSANTVILKSAIQFLSIDNVIEGSYYNRTTQNVDINVNMGRYEPIPVYKGITYHFSKLYAYFCTFVYDDGTKVNFSSTTGNSESGQITASKNGNAYISIYLPNKETAMFSNAKLPNPYSVGVYDPKYVYTVSTDGSGDFTKLSDAINEATNYMDSVVYVERGTYDIIAELGSDYFDSVSQSQAGIVLKNRIKLVFASDSKVVCNYTGSSVNVHSLFSVFNAGEHGFTIENLTLEASNIRYGIHDERGTDTVPYTNRYKNCNIYFDNSANTDWGSSQCIGGGLGQSGEVLIENCVFECVPQTLNPRNRPISYHNSASLGAKSRIVISNTYFAGANSYVGFGYYGQSTKMTDVVLCGNSYGANYDLYPETSDGTSPNVNMQITAWNNEIRS